jgi:hypothetical protein
MITVRDMAKNDEIHTPHAAMAPLYPYLPHVEDIRIWEMCPGEGHMIWDLQMAGWYAWHYDIEDSLVDAPHVDDYDMIVTNPPWSLKHKYLERCYSLNKPFALLLPVRTLGVRRCQLWLSDVDVLFLAKRVDFTGGGAPYEACAWFTRWMLPDRIVFQEEK